MGSDPPVLIALDFPIVHVCVPHEPWLDARIARRRLPRQPGLLRGFHLLHLLFVPLLPGLTDGAMAKISV